MTDPYDRRCFEFSVAAYEQLLRDFKALGYSFVALKEIVPPQKHVFLRHDVDICLDRAVKIAEVEAAEGVAATYYILISTHAYNPAAAWSRRSLRRLVALGHRIGLHFDVTAYPESHDELEDFARRESAILTDLSGAQVDSISFHRPAPDLLGLADRFAGYSHTYEPRFTNDIAYVSDSSGGFFQGHPLDHQAVREGRALHLLTHPLWWTAERSASAEALLEVVRHERLETLNAFLRATIAKAKARAASRQP